MSALGCVLLADDDPMVRETLADLLECDGFEVLVACDAEEAMAIIQAGSATVQVLVTDLSMPGDNGIQLIERARSVYPNLPAILLTGLAEEVSSLSMQGGGFHILRKPVHGEDLAQYIQLLIAAGDAR